jgi:hypothetical protein
VNVTTHFYEVVAEVPVHRHGRYVRIGPVLVDGHAAAVADYPGCPRHVTKDSPTFDEDQLILMYASTSVWILWSNIIHMTTSPPPVTTRCFPATTC